MTMKRVYTVIFDFDGTLANTVELMIKLYNQHADEFGVLKVEENEYESLREMGYKKAMKAKKIRLTKLPKMVRTVLKEMKLQMDNVKPYDEIIETINRLQSHGIRVGVLTSNETPLVNAFFKTHGFPKFDFVVSEKTLFGKEKALRKIMKRNNLNREDVFYVGDEPRDIISSKKAGVKVFGVTWGLAGRTGLLKTPPDHLVDTPRELYQEILRATEG